MNGNVLYDRRAFITCAGGGFCFLMTAPAWTKAVQPAMNTAQLVEARYYEKLPNRKIKCLLCPRTCVIDDLERGYCGVRENRDGVYYTLVYGKPCTLHVDPIEKKPLFHFLPGSEALSIATAGCNVFCKFCQNWEISQSRPEQLPSLDFPPAKLVALTHEKKCPVIAFTYNEPVVFTEYMYDIAEKARGIGVHTAMISNGYIQTKPLKDLCRVLSAVKIDLKAFSERFYKELVSGQLQPVLDSLILLKQEKIWLEIVYLVIPGQNDDPNELSSLCKWIYKELGSGVPLHFTRFYPQYRLTNVPATPLQTLHKARKIAQDAGLQFVYSGNVPGDPGENTYCSQCSELLIKRMGYAIVENKIMSGQCPKCHTPIPGIWK